MIVTRANISWALDCDITNRLFNTELETVMNVTEELLIKTFSAKTFTYLEMSVEIVR